MSFDARGLKAKRQVDLERPGVAGKPLHRDTSPHFFAVFQGIRFLKVKYGLLPMGGLPMGTRCETYRHLQIKEGVKVPGQRGQPASPESCQFKVCLKLGVLYRAAASVDAVNLCNGGGDTVLWHHLHRGLLYHGVSQAAHSETVDILKVPSRFFVPLFIRDAHQVHDAAVGQHHGGLGRSGPRKPVPGVYDRVQHAFEQQEVAHPFRDQDVERGPAIRWAISPRSCVLFG